MLMVGVGFEGCWGVLGSVGERWGGRLGGVLGGPWEGLCSSKKTGCGMDVLEVLCVTSQN